MEREIFYSVNRFYRKIFGEKVYKVTVKANFTCPNRDGRKGRGGCIFCSGSNLIPKSYERGDSISVQLVKGIRQIKKKYKNVRKFIAYFQDFSATYGELWYLKKVYEEALSVPGVVGLAIGTRPDCIFEDLVSYLKDLSNDYFLQIELGLQSAVDRTLRMINRGHTVSEYVKGHLMLKGAGVHIVTHIIFGFPWETEEDFYNTVKFLNNLGTDGIKFHPLHVIKGTPLARWYEKKPFRLLEEDEYASIVAKSLEILNPKTVVHRLSGETTKDLLVAPLWILNKHKVREKIVGILKQRGSFQGKLFETFDVR